MRLFFSGRKSRKSAAFTGSGAASEPPRAAAFTLCKSDGAVYKPGQIQRCAESPWLGPVPAAAAPSGGPLSRDFRPMGRVAAQQKP